MPKQCYVIVCKCLLNAKIKSNYLAIFVIWPQSLNCLFHVGIAVLDMGRAGVGWSEKCLEFSVTKTFP